MDDVIKQTQATIGQLLPLAQIQLFSQQLSWNQHKTLLFFDLPQLWQLSCNFNVSIAYRT